jgi:hypothetical protein
MTKNYTGGKNVLDSRVYLLNELNIPAKTGLVLELN